MFSSFLSFLKPVASDSTSTQHKRKHEGDCSNSNKSQKNETYFPNVSLYTQGTNSIIISDSQSENLLKLINNDSLNLNKETKNLLTLLINNALYQGFSKREIQYLFAKILESLDTKEDIFEIEKQIRECFNNDPLLSCILKDIIAPSGLLDKRFAHLDVSQEEIYKELKNYLSSNVSSFIGSKVEISKEQLQEELDFIVNNQIIGTSTNINVDEKYGPVRVEKIEFRIEALNVNLAQGQNGSIQLSWNVTIHIEIKGIGKITVLGKKIKKTFSESLRHTRISGLSNLSINLKDSLVPEISTQTNLNLDHAKVKILGFDITNQIKNKLNNLVQEKLAPILDTKAQNLLENVLNKKVLPRLTQEVAKINNNISINDHAAYFKPNIKNIEYSTLKWSNDSKLFLNIRANGNPVVIDPILEKQLIQEGMKFNNISYKVNPLIDDSSQLTLKSFLRADAVSILITNFVKNKPISKTIFEHNATLSAGGITFAKMTEEGFRALVPLNADIKGNTLNTSLSAALNLEGKLYYDKQTMQLCIINPDYKIEGINGNNALIAMFFKVSTEVFDYAKHEDTTAKIKEKTIDLSNIEKIFKEKILDLTKKIFKFGSALVSIKPTINSFEIVDINTTENGIIAKLDLYAQNTISL